MVFGWSIYNGATFYIDVFGKRFQNELEQVKRDVAKWQGTPEASGNSGSPEMQRPKENNGIEHMSLDGTVKSGGAERAMSEPNLVDGKSAATGNEKVDGNGVPRERTNPTTGNAD